MYSNYKMKPLMAFLLVLSAVIVNFSFPHTVFAENIIVKEFRNTQFMQQLLDLFLQSSFNINNSNTNTGTGSSGSFGGSSPSSVNTGDTGAASSGTGFSLNQPYGGKVLAAIPCTCSPGDFLITLGPPSAGTYLFSPTSVPTIYKYGLVIVPGVNHLGFYRPFGLCKMIATPCTVIPVTRGVITSVATSLPGK